MKFLTKKIIILSFIFLSLFSCFPVIASAEESALNPMIIVDLLTPIFPQLIIAKGASSAIDVGKTCLLTNPVDCIANGVMRFTITGAEILSTTLLHTSIELLATATDPQFLGIGFTPSNNPYISIGWGIVKNVANAALIIGLVFIAISIILGKEENKAKKTLINFIIIALLINFTPVICGFIIDGSNIITSSFSTGAADSAYDTSVNKAFQLITNSTSTIEIKFALALITFIFSLFAIVVFFLYAILFFARVVILWILVIVSPIAFATKVFPQSKYIKKVFPSILYWDDWWESFIQWCVIGIPAGMSIYIANKMIADFALLADKQTDPLSILISYIIPFIFLVGGFFITISAGGQAGSFVGGLATGAWAASGGRAIGKGKELVGAAGTWAGERAGAAGTWAKEGATGRAAGYVSNLIGNEKIDTSTIEGREAGRQAWAGWKQRAVQDTPLKYLTTPPELGKDKDAALENYSKNWSRYGFDDRQKMEKMLIDKDPSAFLKGAIDKDKNATENSKEYQRRFASVSINGGDKAKFEGYLHASGNTNLMNTGGSTNNGLANIDKWATDNKINVAEKMQSMSAKDAKDKIGADAIRKNPKILQNMGSKIGINIMQQGSENQRKAMYDQVLNPLKNKDFMDHMKNSLDIVNGKTLATKEEEENAPIDHERAVNLLRVVWRDKKNIK